MNSMPKNTFLRCGSVLVIAIFCALLSLLALSSLPEGAWTPLCGPIPGGGFGLGRIGWGYGCLIPQCFTGLLVWGLGIAIVVSVLSRRSRATTDALLDKSETDNKAASAEEWECEVCGAIVDANATVCPVCGAQFEDEVADQKPNELEEVKQRAESKRSAALLDKGETEKEVASAVGLPDAPNTSTIKPSSRRPIYVLLALTSMFAIALIALIVGAAGTGSAVLPGKTSQPDSGKIAFNSNRDGNVEIYVMNSDGSGQTRLTTNPEDGSDPAWSPDGRKIAFTSDRDGNAEIYVMNSDGSEQTRLTTNSANDYSPAWSPDGRKFAFISDRDGNLEIYVMNSDGSGQTRLTTNLEDDFDPAWSPDGRRIAFDSFRNGNNQDVYVMNSDGSGQTRLTAGLALDGDPAWSPDGRKIAFTSNRGNYYLAEIYVMNSDGSGQTRLTTNAYAISLAWSPDGRKIAFTSNAEDYEIYVVNSDGSGQTNLTNEPAQDTDPDWQP
jgi:Tol biopolymer transport system component